MSGNPGELVVTYASLNQAAEDIRRQARELQADLDDIKTSVAQVAESWEGEAKTAYNAQQQKWDQSAAHIQTNLQQIATAVTTASGNYSATDKKAASHFGG